MSEKTLVGKDVCIVDGEEVKRGYKVKDDIVIELIRNIKNKLGVAKNNNLYVCEKHYSEVIKKRKGYERNVFLIYGLLAIIFIFSVLIPLINGTFQIFSLISFLLMVIIFTVILVIFSHVPMVEDKITEIKRGRKKK